MLKIQINFWDRKSGIKYPATELSFPHASYLVQDVRMADIRLASLVNLPCLRQLVLHAYSTFASKQPFRLLYLGHAQTIM